MMHQLDARLVLLVAVGLFIPVTVLALGDGFISPHAVRTPEERAAASVAKAYVQRYDRLKSAADYDPWILKRRGQWEVSFPPPGSFTHYAGPILTVDPGAGRVVRAVMMDAVVTTNSTD
ncbi:MAG: hypothetical protein JWP49_2117 [Phenylobacterium sp.]|nr:hypothetical protein [Phenylobacterium sp.]